ncbi:C40 family peptidase [Candidatus Dojkabacteria bacterium]|jgi:hypothetical protein|nr:C40 family peptidase [Candidatus Dojkabacteria bacterium]
MEQKATQQALSVGANPLVLALAKQMLGKKAYVGYCQQFVKEMGGTTRGASAIQAWNNAQNKVQGTQGIQPGDLVYFSPNSTNQGFGHTGVYEGDNKYISATNSGVLRNDLNAWQTATGQKLLGYVPQSERQAQNTQSQNTQVPQAPRKLVVPQYNPVQMSAPQARPLNVPLTLPTQEPDNTTYGRITVPNL